MLVVAPGAMAQDSFNESMKLLDVVAVVQDNGDVEVTENIVWNFGAQQKHGIFRYIPEKSPWTGTRPEGAPEWEEYRRVTEVDWKGISSVTAPASADISSERGTDGSVFSVAKIGDAEIFITGEHRYTLKYTIRKAVSQNVMFLGLTGEGWTVPIEQVRLRLTGPLAGASGVRCIRSGEDVSGCEVSVVGDQLTLSTNGKGAEVFVPLRAGNYAAVKLEPVQTLRRAFDPGRGAGPIAAVATLLAAAGAIRIGKKGRDRVFASGSPLGDVGALERPRRLGERIASPVEFEPPEGIRPGLVEAAQEGAASQRSVTAMVADLAVRGAISIETFDEEGKSFRLTRNERARDGRELTFTQNESRLIELLFHQSGTVTSDELADDASLAPSMAGLRANLVNEAVEHDWWDVNPQNVQKAWGAKGGMALLGAIGLTIYLALKTRFALVGIAAGVFALGILFFASKMPVKTATGSRISARLAGFEKLFDAGEGERLQLAERLRADKDLFSNYLPYALAFGNVNRWVKTFGALGVAEVATPWITGPGFGYGYGYGHMGGAMFNDRSFSNAMEGFDRSLNSSIAAGAAAAAAEAARQSSSSGGSGGGFSGGGSSGGGGGGSW